MSNPKSPVTDLLRKLKRDIDNALPSLQAVNETLGDVMARVGEVEGLEQRGSDRKGSVGQ